MTASHPALSPGRGQAPAAPPGGVAPVSRRVMNLAHFLVQAARRHPLQPALICGDRRYTWRELDERTAALAQALADHGIGKGDRVLVHSRNCFEFVETLFATLRLGAVWVPTNFRISPDEAVYLPGRRAPRRSCAMATTPGMPRLSQTPCRSCRCWRGWGPAISPCGMWPA